MTSRHKILIVEDDSILQNMYKVKFIVEGFEVHTADNGKDALERAHIGKPDIVLLDILMPRLNGLEALAEIRRDPAIKDVPVVMLTNLSNIDKMEQAINLGAAGYLVKSATTPQQVLEFVKDTIAKHTAH
jgi:two-component system alkaline phosphatase synthesis response regulator PhoP